MIRFSKSDSQLYAVGRVLSGTLFRGLKIRILGDNYEVGKNIDLFEKYLDKIYLSIRNEFVEVDSISAGNIVFIKGIDRYISK